MKADNSVKLTAEEILKKHFFDIDDERSTLIAKIAMNEYAKQAFNAGQETQHYNPDDVDTFEIPKYETWEDYLNSLK